MIVGGCTSVGGSGTLMDVLEVVMGVGAPVLASACVVSARGAVSAGAGCLGTGEAVTAVGRGAVGAA